MIVVVPKDVLWRLGAVLHDAGEVDVTADIDVEFRSAQDHCLGSYVRRMDGTRVRKRKKKKNRFGSGYVV